jgi:hypothetical protein
VSDGDLLGRLDERTRNLDAKLDAILEQTTATNGRLRTVEAWQAWIKGGLAVLSLAVPAVTGLVVYIITS